MRKQLPREWTEQARAMALDGRSWEAIAAHFGIVLSRVRAAVDDDYRAARRAWRAQRPKASPQAPRPTRAVAATLDREAVMPAARAFAAGQIDRAELMRRITRGADA